MNLSPAAQAFWGSVIRHVLTALAGILVAHGYVSNDVAHPYVEEGVGLALQGIVMVWANRIVYWQQIRAIVGRAMPAATHHDVIAKVEELKDAKALPSVFTAPTAVPSLVKPLIVIAMLGLGAALLPACANLTAKLPHLPDGSLDVRALVSWVNTGVELDCQYAATSPFCIFGRDGVKDATAAMDKNPANMRAAAAQSFRDSIAKWPSMDVVFGWIVKDLS
jgi:hypothetical protein